MTKSLPVWLWTTLACTVALGLVLLWGITTVTCADGAAGECVAATPIASKVVFTVVGCAVIVWAVASARHAGRPATSSKIISDESPTEH